MPTHILTREELYEQVWSRPMVQVAHEYGLSDRGLAKLCDRHEIPVPPRGYWAKKAHGHKVSQPALPPASHARLNRIAIDSSDRPKAPEAALDIPEIAFEFADEHRIIVPDELTRIHPFVRKTRQAFTGQKPGDRGLLYPAAPCLDVCVSSVRVPHALPSRNTGVSHDLRKERSVSRN